MRAFRTASFARLRFVIACLASWCAATGEDEGRALTDLKQLSLEQLTSLPVSTISRHDEPWWTAPAAIDVITSQELRWSGITSLPDALRLATGVHVAQSSARTWAISTRGFNVISANKISVTLDGRSLFTPFFSGVQWNAQDTLIEDIDRIEVARGPVGALWGAYAVNGFIQILTKPAWNTQGWIASVATGTDQPLRFAARYGGKLGDETFYRVYAKYWQQDWTYDAAGRSPQPATDFLQIGFRADTLRGRDTTLTLQGDLYTNKDLPLDRVQTELSGGNVLGRFRRLLSDGAEVTLEAYLEQTKQEIPINFTELRRTASVSAKYQFTRGRHMLMVGADALMSDDRIGGAGVVGLDPPERTFHNIGIFAHDTYVWSDDVKLILGAKAEHNAFSGTELSPTLRASWTPSHRTTFWAAASKAVRSPVRLDVDLYTRANGVSLFEANEDFAAEYITALELGWRRQLRANLSTDLSLFWNEYRDIRSFEPLDAAPLPLTFRNSLTASSGGGELTVLYQPTPAVQFKGAYRYLDLDWGRASDSRDIGNAVTEGNDPRHVLLLSAHAQLPAALELSAYFRHVSALPNPAVGSYSTADATLLWRPHSAWEIALAGRNLLDARHRELITTNSLSEWIGRQFLLKATWRY